LGWSEGGGVWRGVGGEMMKAVMKF